MALKQRYTVTVAGYEMNVRSDNTPDEVEEIVGALDRGIRDVCARNRNLPRNEAIILCALDAYSEKRRAVAEARAMEAQLMRIEHECDLLRAYIERHAKVAEDAGADADIDNDADNDAEKENDNYNEVSEA